MTETQPSRRAAVYRLFAADGALLYIGSAFDPEERCKAHAGTPWWSTVTRRTEEWHPTRGRAYSAEMGAIADGGTRAQRDGLRGVPRGVPSAST